MYPLPYEVRADGRCMRTFTQLSTATEYAEDLVRDGAPDLGCVTIDHLDEYGHRFEFRSLGIPHGIPSAAEQSRHKTA